MQVCTKPSSSLIPLLLRRPCQLCDKRLISTSSVVEKRVSGKFKVSIKHDNPITYEEAQYPFHIGVRKDWASFNTANFTDFGLWKSEIAIQDMFIRKFVSGTWHDLFVSHILIKRQFNLIRISGIVQRTIHPRKMYFLLGYTEEILSLWLQCVVKLEIQTVDSKKDMVFKYV